jgi:hypothetical protein
MLVQLRDEISLGRVDTPFIGVGCGGFWWECRSCLLVSDVLLGFCSTPDAVIVGGVVAGSCCWPPPNPWWRMVVASRVCGRGAGGWLSVARCVFAVLWSWKDVRSWVLVELKILKDSAPCSKKGSF